MSNIDDWIVVGRFGRVHGIKGFITIHSYTDPQDNILKYDQWYARINNQWELLNLKHIDVNDKHILVQVEGYPEREKVAALTNVEIAIERQHLPTLSPGEYYWRDLIGLEVINQEGIVLGKVSEILPTGANDVLIVKGDKQHLIPYLPDRSIITIDIQKRQILVDWDADF